jgi:hypothetical protein
MKIDDLTPPVEMPEPLWKQQLSEFWKHADDIKKIDLQVLLKMGDAAGAKQLIESWQQEVVERKKKKSRKSAKKKRQSTPVRYAWGGYWTPGYNFGDTELGGGGDGGGESVREGVNTGMAQGSMIGDTGAQSTWDGVSPDTQMTVNEDNSSSIKDFVAYCAKELGIEQTPRLRLRRDPAWSERNHSFGQFDPDRGELNVSVAGRHIMDIFRTVAHELVHYQQNEQNRLPADAGATGSRYENEANAEAGVLMRNYAQLHPEYFEDGVVAESSGYIPTKKERNDPRFKMALSPDVQPGATGKNANRMSLKTGEQGEPQLLIKGLKNALREFKETGGLPLTEDQDLFEIDMSPGNLRRLVRDIDARAGIEFEMIVPGVETDEDEDLEPDYNTDERVNSISDAYDFFFDGDYNGRRDVNSLKEAMQEEFFEWQMEQLDDLWDRDGLDYLRDYIDNNGIFDRDDYMDEAREYVRDMLADNDEPADEQSDRFLDAVTERLDDLADTFVQSSWHNRDEHYDQAREEFNEEFMGNYEEDEWLSDQGLRYMSDVESRYSDEIRWPHWHSTGGGEMQIDDVAEDFSEAIGRPVNAASRYHGARREAGTYVVEPDGSLEGDEPGDGGLEFVSPPLPLDELLSDMEKVRKWAKGRGCYTNSSTGLHMNVSVPNTSTAKLDYVKLALLLGDEHVLQEFGRASNTYAGSALKKIREILKNKPDAANQVLNKMRDHMEALATKVIHTGETQKFTSINTKGDYVEFRSPGGDWLDENWDRVTPTLLRTVVALDAAMDPNKYRKEYQKKLYKLLDSSQERLASPNVNKLLSMYFTADSEGGSREIAVKLAKELLVKRDPSRKIPEPRPADSQPAAPGSGRWGLWITGLDKFATRNNERLEFDSREAARDWYADEAMMRPGIRSDIEIREIPADQDPGPADAEQYNSGNLTPQGAAPWAIYNRRTGEFLRVIDSTTATAAEQEARRALGFRAENPEDYEVRSRTAQAALAQPQQGSGAHTYRVFTTHNNQTVGTFQSDGIHGSTNASIAFRNYLRSIGRESAAGFNYELIGSERPQAAAQQTTAAEQTYEIYDQATGQSLEQFQAAGPTAAVEFLNDYRTQGPHRLSAAEAEQRFGVRPAGAADALPPMMPLDIEIERAPRTLTTPGQPQQQFSGEWKIVDASGRELHRFGGVGNVQADANRVALAWLRQNPRHMQDGVEVVPVMSE